MGLPKGYMSVILSKHQSSIYRKLNRNGSGGVYTGKEAQATSEQRRLENKPSPKTDDNALMKEITALFKKDLLPDQIARRLKVQSGKAGFNIDPLQAYLSGNGERPVAERPF
ncbi:MAG: hypothetical protein LBU28_03330 [Spirochaetaceae bacterium]|nr:hypothetical protein [Spirochaetaceae bacterium]